MRGAQKGKLVLITVFMAALISVLFLACSSRGTPTATPTPTEAGEKHIEILAYNWGYDPAEIVVPLGTKVHLTITVLEHEHDHGAPEIKAPDGTIYHHGFSIPAYGIALQLPLGETETEFIADKAGTFPYACTVYCGISEDGAEGHHTMMGKLVVFEGANPPAGYSETPDGYRFTPPEDVHDHDAHDGHDEATDPNDEVADHDKATIDTEALLLNIYIVDSFGFHGMQEDYETATEVESRDAGKVKKVLTAVQTAGWPHELEDVTHEFVEVLEALHTTLEAEDLEGARTGFAEVHHAQHDFSKAVYAWLEAKIKGEEFHTPEGHH